MTESNIKFPQLETDRLLLRQVKLDDNQAIFDYYTDPLVTEYFMEPLTDPQKAQAIAQEYAGYDSVNTGIVWAITLKPNPTLIGTCGYETFSRYDKRGEIGYDLARKYWGQGIAKEALRAIIEYSFADLDLNRIQAYVLAENTRSIRRLESLRFAAEGVLRDYRWFNGKFSNWALLSLLKKDWLASNGD
jgi:ribosomal-protein-alanine N-acetyltransferase